MEQLDHLRQLQATGAFAEKGVYDYTSALERCYATEARYVGMFEDDILLADGWLVRALLGLSELPVDDGANSPWLFMRIFNQERSTGWATRRIGGNNEAGIIAGIALGIVAVTLPVRQYWQAARTYLDLEALGVLVLVLNPALVVLFYQSGKASMLPPSPGVFQEPFGCCSQAMIFPRSNVPLLIDFLQERREGQVDLLLNDLAQKAGLARYAMYPVQAQHIGEMLSNTASRVLQDTDMLQASSHRA